MTIPEIAVYAEKIIPMLLVASLILGTGWTLYLEWLNLKSLVPTAWR